jgi:nitroreductase
MHMDRPVFVFSSDLAGQHDSGDALVALQTRGAVYGQGSGPQGGAYAIPTRERTGEPRARHEIAESVSAFLSFTRMRPWALFDVAPVGCGAAGYSAEEIAPMFVAARHNVTLPKAFEDVLSRRTLGKTQGAQKS